ASCDRSRRSWWRAATSASTSRSRTCPISRRRSSGRRGRRVCRSSWRRRCWSRWSPTSDRRGPRSPTSRRRSSTAPTRSCCPRRRRRAAIRQKRSRSWPASPCAPSGRCWRSRPRAGRSTTSASPRRSRTRPPRPPTRSGRTRFVPVLLALVAVWGTGGLALSRRAAERYDAAVGDTLAALSALVNATQNELRREAGILAKDPAIVEGALKSDWATLARGASPRMLALTLERIADLLLVVDASGAPLVQVPPMPRVEGLGIPRPTEAVARVAVVNDRAYLLGLAPLPAGMVVVGRRVESLDRLLAGLPSRPAVVVVAGDLAIGGTLPGVPARGWLDAARAGHVAVNGQPWLVRPLAGVAGGSLWALVSEGNRRAAEQWFWFWWALSLVAAVGVAVAAGSVGSSKGAATAPPTPPLGVARAKPALATKPPLETESVPPAPTERLRPELEARYRSPWTTGSGASWR